MTLSEVCEEALDEFTLAGAYARADGSFVVLMSSRRIFHLGAIQSGVNGGVFLASYDRDGELEWARPLGTTAIDPSYRATVLEPVHLLALADDRAAVHVDGTWSTFERDGTPGPTRRRFSWEAAARATGDSIAVSTRNSLVVLDGNLNERWAVDSPPSALAVSDDGTVFGSYLDDELRAFDGDTGELRWAQPVEYRQLVPAGDGVLGLYTASQEALLNAILHDSTGTEAWSVQLGKKWSADKASLDADANGWLTLSSFTDSTNDLPAELRFGGKESLRTWNVAIARLLGAEGLRFAMVASDYREGDWYAGARRWLMHEEEGRLVVGALYEQRTGISRMSEQELTPEAMPVALPAAFSSGLFVANLDTQGTMSAPSTVDNVHRNARLLAGGLFLGEHGGASVFTSSSGAKQVLQTDAARAVFMARRSEAGEWSDLRHLAVTDTASTDWVLDPGTIQLDCDGTADVPPSSPELRRALYRSLGAQLHRLASTEVDAHLCPPDAGGCMAETSFELADGAGRTRARRTVRDEDYEVELAHASLHLTVSSSSREGPPDIMYYRESGIQRWTASWEGAVFDGWPARGTLDVEVDITNAEWPTFGNREHALPRRLCYSTRVRADSCRARLASD